MKEHCLKFQSDVHCSCSCVYDTSMAIEKLNRLPALKGSDPELLNFFIDVSE